jgi:hypothetical protein
MMQTARAHRERAETVAILWKTELFFLDEDQGTGVSELTK